MPYNTISELPQQVRSSLTSDLQEIYMEAYNSAYDNACKNKSDREACANKAAWAAVKNVAAKGEDGVWRKAGANSTELETRMLRSNLNEQQVQVVEKDGGLLVKNVNMLGEGTWTDSAVQTPLFYPGDTLRKYADNWIDKRLWARHAGGSPRSLTEVVAEIENVRYNEESRSIKADLFFHGATQASADMIKYVKYCMENDIPLFVSVEHGGRERYNAEQKQYEASELIFGGAAIVPQGACRTCRINSKNEQIGDINMTEENPENDKPVENDTGNENEDAYKLEDVVNELASVKELMQQQTEALKQLSAGKEQSDSENENDDSDDNPDSKDETIKQLQEQVNELSSKVKELENRPNNLTQSILDGDKGKPYSDSILFDKEGITRKPF